jgi:short-subunit dehydrogenase
MTTSGDTATVLITGPTSRLGRALALMVGRPETDRPDLLLVGRPGQRLTEVVDLVRAAGATAEAIPYDLSRLAERHRSRRDGSVSREGGFRESSGQAG